MKVGIYDLTSEGVKQLAYIFFDSQRVRFGSIPKLTGSTPQEIAAQVLRHNAGSVLYAGQGHFHFMWMADFGKAIRGAFTTLSSEYLGKLIEKVILDSSHRGEVSACFTVNHLGFCGMDMPYPRIDGLPWLLHCLYEYQQFTKEHKLMNQYRHTLQALLDRWEAAYLENGLIPKSVTGDWMDTVLRPSST